VLCQVGKEEKEEEEKEKRRIRYLS